MFASEVGGQILIERAELLCLKHSTNPTFNVPHKQCFVRYSVSFGGLSESERLKKALEDSLRGSFGVDAFDYFYNLSTTFFSLETVVSNGALDFIDLKYMLFLHNGRQNGLTYSENFFLKSVGL